MTVLLVLNVQAGQNPLDWADSALNFDLAAMDIRNKSRNHQGREQALSEGTLNAIGPKDLLSQRKAHRQCRPALMMFVALIALKTRHLISHAALPTRDKLNEHLQF